MSYIDGYLIPVSAAKREAYEAFAARAAPIFLEHGALQVAECWGDDLQPNGGHAGFPGAVMAQGDEMVVLAWVLWPSREARDAGTPKVMGDPRMAMDEAAVPFDGERAVAGGFRVFLDSRT